MEPFLQTLAAKLYNDYSSKLSKICIVFPNRRAGLFLQQYLSSMIQTPIWMPQMFALEDFVLHLSGKTKSNQLILITRLFKVYRSLSGDNKQSFSEFLAWGNMLLSDFDEIDQYLQDGEKIFNYLDELKIMQHWNPDGSPLTQFELKYLHFYNSLAPLYTEFTNQLTETNEGYFGLLFKQLLEKNVFLNFTNWDKVVFAGFNALTPAEEKLIDAFVKADKSDVYWDGDNYYVKDSNQEAGRFLRKYIKESATGNLNWIGNSLLENPINLNVIGVPGNVGQAKLAGEISKQHKIDQGNVNGLAMVLVDEAILLPVLNSIPVEVGEFNVTMGFPIKQTPLYFLISSIVTLFINASKHNTSAASGEEGMVKFYYKDIHRILSHPYLSACCDKKRNQEVEALQKSFYTRNEFLLLLSQQISALNFNCEEKFPIDYKNADELIAFIRQLLLSLFDFFTHDSHAADEKLDHSIAIDAEYLHLVLDVFDTLTILVQDEELQINSESLGALFGTLVANIKLPFYGEPLNGMQLMGMLETRLLDFSDIILISANEGMLPKKKQQNTFIPDEVRRAFGLQVNNEKNAVFAYHFYRLLQRSKHVWILYNTEGDELGGGEKSRFVTQLLHELKNKNPLAHITEKVIAQIPGSNISGLEEVQKSRKIKVRLDEMAQKGISPTALSAYLRCNLQFYYAQILKISEPEQLTDSLDAAELGKIVHDALKNLYVDFAASNITVETSKAMQASVNQYLEKSFLQEYSLEELSTGRNLLIVKVAENMIQQLLKVEQEFVSHNPLQLTILRLEEWLTAEIEINERSSGISKKIVLKGQADRIDMLGGILRIIDYKSGSLKEKELVIEKISDLTLHEEPSKILQVLLYAYMYIKNNNLKEVSIQSGIISLLKPSAYIQSISINKEKVLTSQMLQEFEDTLGAILTEIFDLDTPFKATSDKEKCKRCAFKTICNKVV